ncbi:hypothetical protein HYV84_00395 [Candidatus Woesearchaeota archaeon]|nr:hypothetical protein [Candidatus Woesearchaeota archaeon]
MEHSKLPTKNFYLRKLAHFINGIFLLLITDFLLDRYGTPKMLLAGTGILLLVMAGEFLRIETGLVRWLNIVAKKQEYRRFSSLIDAIAINLLMFAVFPTPIAFATMSISAFGDGAAGLFGRMWGKHKTPFNENKSWEGFLAYAVVGSVFASFFVPPPLAVTMAIVASFIEINCKYVEDNLIVPPTIAFLAYAIQALL